jgi:hypothetical protein
MGAGVGTGTGVGVTTIIGVLSGVGSTVSVERGFRMVKKSEVNKITMVKIRTVRLVRFKRLISITPWQSN